MVESPSVRFGELARSVAKQAWSLDLVAPVFRSPPRIVGVSRTIRRRADGQAVVSVSFRNRPWPAVVCDLIEGVIAVNGLSGSAACRARDDLWEPLERTLTLAA